MESILLSKVLLLIAGMLFITTIFARINKAYETIGEAIATIAGSFIFLFVLMGTSNSFPLNLVTVGIFSGFIGWSMGPTISYFGNRYKFNKYTKSKGLKSKQIITEKKSAIAKIFGAEDEKKTVFYYRNDPSNVFDRNDSKYREIEKQFEQEILSKDKYNQEWQNIVFLALLGTTCSVILTSLIVYFLDTDFGFLGKFLFISLCSLIVVSILNILIFKSRIKRLFQSFAGIIIFTLYLIYDINILESKIAQGDNSWSTAINIAVNIYLDIVNLFLDILDILSDLT